MRISDWSSDVCSSDLVVALADVLGAFAPGQWRLAEGDVADQVERADPLSQLLLDFVGQLVPQDALAGKFFDNCVLLLGISPASQEKIGRASCRERVWQYV